MALDAEIDGIGGGGGKSNLSAARAIGPVPQAVCHRLVWAVYKYNIRVREYS